MIRIRHFRRTAKSSRTALTEYTSCPLSEGNAHSWLEAASGHRFSPDGTRTAYWTGERTFRPAKIYIVASAGGNPMQFQPDFHYAAFPIWSPDGRYIVFVGSRGRDRQGEIQHGRLGFGGSRRLREVPPCVRRHARRLRGKGCGLRKARIRIAGSYRMDGPSRGI